MFNTYRRQYERLVRVIQGVAQGDGYSVQFGGAKVVKCNTYGVTEAEKDAKGARTRLAAAERRESDALVRLASMERYVVSLERMVARLRTALDEMRDALAAKDEELQGTIAALEEERARREQARPAQGGTLRGALDASGRPKSTHGWGPYSAAGLGLASIGEPVCDEDCCPTDPALHEEEE